MVVETLHTFCVVYCRRIERLYSQANAAQWQLSQERFAEALFRSASSRFKQADPSAQQITSYLDSLHLADLALAAACAEGNEPAWEHFFRAYRSELYGAARAILRSADEARARELADSVYAELYGLEERSGLRRSLFDYFHGRSKLSTWLHAVLAQRHVDMLRGSQRLESFDSREDASHEESSRRMAGLGFQGGFDPDRPRYLDLLQTALLGVLSSLEPRDRLRLAYYYAQGLTLAQIGRLLGEHEATVSRHLDRSRREIRTRVEHALSNGKGLSSAQIQLCFEYALEDWPFDLARAFPQERPPRPEE